MVAVPVLMPVTEPVLEPTVATPVLLLLQVPPPVALLSVVLAPIHTVDDPAMADGTAFTVTAIVL